MQSKISYYDSVVFGSGLFGRLLSLVAEKECIALPSDPSLRETLKIPRVFWKRNDFKAALENLGIKTEDIEVPVKFCASGSLLDPSPSLYEEYSELIYGQSVKRKIPSSIEGFRVDIVEAWSLPVIKTLSPSCIVTEGSFGLEFIASREKMIASKIVSTVPPSVLQPFFEFEEYDLSWEEMEILSYGSSFFHPLKLMGCKIVTGTSISELQQMIVYVIDSQLKTAYRLWINPLNSYFIDRRTLRELDLHKTDVIVEFKPPGSYSMERRILRSASDAISMICKVDGVLKEEWYTILRRGKLTMKRKDVNEMEHLTLGGKIVYVGRTALGKRVLLSDIPKIAKEV